MDQAERLRNIIKQQTPAVLRKTARVITITSGKGGVGKSSISVNLAIQLSKLGKRVIILDADFGLANIEVMLGIRPQYNLADLLFRGKGIVDIVTKGPENIGFISGGSGIQELSELTREQIQSFSQKLYELDEIADIIIIDTGAGINDNVFNFAFASSEVLLVVTPEPTSITDAYALLKIMNNKMKTSNEDVVVKMIANKVESLEEGKHLYNKLKIVVEKFLTVKIDYLGAVPQDPVVSKAIIQQKPYSLIYPNSISTKAVVDLANVLCDYKPITNSKPSGISHIFSKLIRSKMMK